MRLNAQKREEIRALLVLKVKDYITLKRGDYREDVVNEFEETIADLEEDEDYVVRALRELVLILC
jgi:hypothetical protein